jgi:hypothetical protein
LGVAATTLVDLPGTGFGFLTVFAGRYLLWVLTVLILHATAHVLRGKAHFTQTFRVMGFVQTVGLLGLLRFIEPIAPLVVTGVALLSLFAAWLGVSKAHRLRGWRTLALPLLYALFVLVGMWALAMVMTDGELVLSSLAARYGLTP